MASAASGPRFHGVHRTGVRAPQHIVKKADIGRTIVAALEMSATPPEQATTAAAV